jgi:hypothetical protein
MALSTANDWKIALYQILFETEKAFSTTFPNAWVRVSKMDPADRDTILQGYADWKKTYVLNVVPTTNELNTPTYGKVGAAGWVNSTGSGGGTVQSH